MQPGGTCGRHSLSASTLYFYNVFSSLCSIPYEPKFCIIDIAFVVLPFPVGCISGTRSPTTFLFFISYTF